MSNILNLFTASILAVSPIVSQPKMAERPQNVLYEKVDYLDYGIKATSYIFDDQGDIIFLVNFKNDYNFDFSFKFVNETQNFYNSVAIFNSDDSQVFEISFDSIEDKLDFYENFNFYNLLTSDWDVSSTVYLNNFEYDDQLTLFLPNTNISFYQNINNGNQFYLLNENYLSTNSLYRLYVDKYLLQNDPVPIIDNTFALVGNTIEEYVSVVVDLFSQVLALFIVNGQLTILGILLIFTFGIGVVKFGFEFIKSLLRL